VSDLWLIKLHWSDLPRAFGVRSFRSTPFVASSGAHPADGSTPSGFRLLAMSSPLLVSAFHFVLVVPSHFRVGHDSTISIVYPSAGVQTIKINSLPFVTLAWTSEDALVVAGHDCEPIVFSGSGPGSWAAVGSLDDPTAGKSAGGASARSGPVGRLNSAAFNTFKNAAERGQVSHGLPGAGQSAGDTVLLTVHQNTITSVRPYAGGLGAVSHVSTTGVDGKLVVWDVANVSQGSALAAKLAGMHLR
jgi:actin related protein 2/3 complex, subunit 1A/1B